MGRSGTARTHSKAARMRRHPPEPKFVEDAYGRDVHFVNGGDYRAETWMTPSLHDCRAGHFRGIPVAGEPLEHGVHELRFAVHRWDFKEPAEAHQFTGIPS